MNDLRFEINNFSINGRKNSPIAVDLNIEKYYHALRGFHAKRIGSFQAENVRS